MTKQLPYSDLFPYLHPLGTMPDTVDIPSDIKIYLDRHYDFILPDGYLNPEKLQKAMEFLNAKDPKKDIYKNAADFLYSIPYEDIYRVPEHDEKGTSYFWVYTVSAFLFVNQYHTDKSTEILANIRHSFDCAKTHKNQWVITYGVRKGGINRAGKYAKAKEAAYNRWLAFSNKTKNAKAYIAAYELQQIPELFSELKTLPTITTLEKWVREWKRKEKNNVC